MAGSVLVVDDNEDAGRALARLIQRLGHRATAVNSGELAIQFLAEHAPDLVILDMMMPGVDGMAVLRIVRAEPRLQKVNVVLFSAVSDKGFREYAIGEGANDYWVKGSFDFRDLAQRIAPYLPVAAGQTSGGS